MEKIEKNSNLPILSPEGSLNSYLLSIKKFPMLEAKEEYTLAKNWREKDLAMMAMMYGNVYVAKIAMGRK